MKCLYIIILLAVLCPSVGKACPRPSCASAVVDADISTVGLGSLRWKQLFTDHRLQALIDSGLVHNSDLRLAELRVAEAEALLKAAKLAFLPSATFRPQGQLSSFDAGKLYKTYSIATSAEWELDIAGRLSNAKRRLWPMPMQAGPSNRQSEPNL